MFTCQRRVFLAIAFSLVLLVGPAAVIAAPATPGSPAPSAAPAARKHAPVCLPGGPGSARCHSHVIVDDNGRPVVNAVPVGGYGPAYFQAAYLPNGTTTGGIVAVVDAYDNPTVASDLSTYSEKFFLLAPSTCSTPLRSAPAGCFLKVNQSGDSGNYPSPNSGWGLEIALDVETVHALCPTCKIVLVEANSNSFSDLIAAVDEAVLLGATVVSNSYGAREFSGETTYDSHFNKTGVAFTFSSGDSGYGTEYPAASGYVTAVGGTSLQMSSGANGVIRYSGETAWSGAGSGCSSQESKPSWQHDSGCARRTIADVSADADPNTGAAVYDSSYNASGGWFQVGGTSLASPIIASVYAQGAVTLNVDPANSLPYFHYPGNFHDVVGGSNGGCSKRIQYLCTAVRGYDGPTSLGTPYGPGGF